MIRNVTQLSVKVDERIYCLYCDHESPIGHLKEALFQFSKLVAQVEENILTAQKNSEEHQSSVSDIQVEEVK